MKLNVKIFVAASLLLSTAACDSSRRMVGPYTLVRTDECKTKDIRFSHLVLKPDGTYDQTHELTNGEIFYINGEHWTYSRNTIHLRNFHVSLRQELEVEKTGTDVSLKADPSRPPFISLPNSKCYYGGPK
jgi:hypothetical protein